MPGPAVGGPLAFVPRRVFGRPFVSRGVMAPDFSAPSRTVRPPDTRRQLWSTGIRQAGARELSVHRGLSSSVFPPPASGLVQHDSPQSGGLAALRKAGHLVLVCPSRHRGVPCRGLQQPALAVATDAPRSQWLTAGSWLQSSLLGGGPRVGSSCSHAEGRTQGGRAEPHNHTQGCRGDPASFPSTHTLLDRACHEAVGGKCPTARRVTSWGRGLNLL